MVEVCARGAVAVPVVVVEEIRALLMAFVVQIYPWTAVVGGFVRGSGGDVFDEFYLWSRGAVGEVRGGGRRGVVVRVGDDCVFGPVRGAGLGVVVRVSRAAAPSSHADVGFAVGEGADKTLEFGVVFDGADARDVAVSVGEDGTPQFGFGLLAGLFPGGAQVLHEQWITFSGGVVVFLLDGDVAAGADDVGDVDEVVAAESVEGDFGLFAFVTVVQGDDGAGGFVRGGEGGGVVWGDGDVEVVVPAVHLEGLRVAGFVGDEDLRHLDWLYRGRMRGSGSEKKRRRRYDIGMEATLGRSNWDVENSRQSTAA